MVKTNNILLNSLHKNVQDEVIGIHVTLNKMQQVNLKDALPFYNRKMKHDYI